MLIREASADPATALFRALNPHHLWTLEVQLRVHSLNVLRDLRWLQTDDATKGKNRPEPILLPWEEPAEREGVDIKRFGTASMTLAEAKEWLGW